MFLVPVSRRNADLSRLFDDTIDRFFSAGSQASDAFSPALDVTETPQHWSVQVDLPGVAKEDVKIAIDGKHVSVEAEVRKEAARAEGDRLVHRERTVSRYARSFRLPAEVEQSESGAKLDSGVLTLTLAKKRPTQSARLQVN
ncbi:MAG TPA: Hsp20/alpha crystallin family protein [Rubrivivax sp.]